MTSRQVEAPVAKSADQGRELRVLLVEDSDHDADRLVAHLKSSGYGVQHQRVYNAKTMADALERQQWNLVLCDYSIPSFNVPSAIEILKQQRIDLPFIVVSGNVAENVAVEVMKAGAHDFISKDSLTRLVPAIDRELREAKLRTQRARDTEKLFYLAAIVDSTGEAIMSHNMEGIITTWNKGAEQLFGYTEAEAVGGSIFMIIPKSMQSDRQEIFSKLSSGKPLEPFETRRVRKNGTEVDVYLAISPIKGLDGKLVGASAIAYDITERKKVENERTRMIDQLNDTLSKVRTLSGLLPICASCKKIRDDKGYWQKLETFVHEHSNAEFSHSICPDCMDRLYPDFVKSQA